MAVERPSTEGTPKETRVSKARGNRSAHAGWPGMDHAALEARYLALGAP